MKKISTIIILVLTITLLATSLSACENSHVVNPTYDYALINTPDGSLLKVELKSWGLVREDYSVDIEVSGSLSAYILLGTDGTGYIVSKRNCTLVNDPSVEINASSPLIDLSIYNYDELTIRNQDGTTTSFKNCKQVTCLGNEVEFKTEDDFLYRVYTDNILIKISCNQ